MTVFVFVLVLVFVTVFVFVTVLVFVIVFVFVTVVVVVVEVVVISWYPSQQFVDHTQLFAARNFDLLPLTTTGYGPFSPPNPDRLHPPICVLVFLPGACHAPIYHIAT